MKNVLAIAGMTFAMTAGQVQAGFSVYAISGSETNYSASVAARNSLTALGHTVTQGGALADYSTFDQVWDLRYNTNLNASEQTAMGNYLQGGGRMYLTGEHSGFDSVRNNSLVSFLNGTGAGPITLTGSVGHATQSITTAGQIVNNPNIFANVQFSAARTVAEASSGFLVTETSTGSGQGSLLGWDFGDIVGKSSARMLVGFDINMLSNGQDWIENMSTYLGAGDSAEAVPEPASIAMWSMMGGIGFIVRRKRKKAIAI